MNTQDHYHTNPSYVVLVTSEQLLCIYTVICIYPFLSSVAMLLLTMQECPFGGSLAFPPD